MLILITGDRNYSNTEAIKKCFELISPNLEIKESTVIHGGAKGADTLAGEYATVLGYKIHKEEANWKKYGKSAGPIRNIEMLKMNPDIVLIFHDDLKNSKGTKHCVKILLKMISKKKKYNPILLFNANLTSKEELSKYVS